MLPVRIVFALGLALAWSSLVARADSLPAVPSYHFIRQISLPGENGWDYLSIAPPPAAPGVPAPQRAAIIPGSVRILVYGPN